MAVTCCGRCGDAILDRDGVILVTVARADGRDSRRIVTCRECAERLLAYLGGRHAELAEASGWGR